MPFSIRRLGPGDEDTLVALATDDADFDLADRGSELEPLAPPAAHAYLADPNVLHWVAEDGGVAVGHMTCQVIRKRAGAGLEVLLYEIGVRGAHRRRGVGRALVGALTAWMTEHGVAEIWVLADNPGAVSFYRACGFASGDPEGAVYMTRELPG